MADRARKENAFGIDDLLAMGEGALAALVGTVVRETDPDEDRDSVLSFCYRLRRADWDAADWAGIGGGIDPYLSDEWERNACVRSLAACALRALLANSGWFSCSRSKMWWSKPNRFKGKPYGYDLNMSCLKWLVENGLLEENRAERGDHIRTGRQSTYRATPLLVSLFPRFQFERAIAFQEIRLRGHESTMMTVPDTEETSRMRAEVREINDFSKTFRVNLPPTLTPYGDGHVMYFNGKGLPSYIRWDGQVRYCRQFCRGDVAFVCGGRLYSDFQNLPSEMRSGKNGMTFTFDGVTSETVEVDFKCQHARMLAARIGIRLNPDEFDPYDVSEINADFVQDLANRLNIDVEEARPLHREWHSKPAYHIAVNAKGWVSTVLAIKRRSEKRAVKESKPEIALTFKQSAKLLKAIKERNADVASAFASDSGVGLQRDDSEIALKVMKRCMAANVPALMVHDSFIVRVQDEAFVRAAMEAEMVAYENSCQPPDVDEGCSPEVSPSTTTLQDPGVVSGVVRSILGSVSSACSSVLEPAKLFVQRFCDPAHVKEEDQWRRIRDKTEAECEAIRRDPRSVSRERLVRMLGTEGLKLLGEGVRDDPLGMQDSAWREEAERRHALGNVDRLFRPKRLKPRKFNSPRADRRPVADRTSPPADPVASRILAMFPGARIVDVRQSA